MNLLRASYFRKTGAMLLLALFVFVHAIKALHTHEISLASSHFHGDDTATDVKAGFFCTICDFQIANDSDAVISTAELVIPVQRIPLLNIYISPVYSFAVTVSSGTDPPSFV